MATQAPIMVISRQQELTEGIKSWGERQGRLVLISRSAREALDQLRSQPTDAVVIDVRMPRLDGMGLSNWLSQLNRETTVIAIGNGDSQKTLKRALSQGVRDFVLSPVAPEHVVQRLERVLAEQRDRKLNGRHLHASRQEPDDSPLLAALRNRSRPPSLKEVQKLYIQHVLKEAGWNVSQAARILGIHRSSLYLKLRQYGLR